MVPNYSDSPSLHAGYLKAAFQVVGWLLFQPTKWRNFVAHLDPSLPPHFSLLQLRREHLRQREMHRLLLVGYIAIPFLTSLLIGLPDLLLYNGLHSVQNWTFLAHLTGIWAVSVLLSALLGVGSGILGGVMMLVTGVILDWSVPSLHLFGTRLVVGTYSPINGFCAGLAGFSMGFATHARLQSRTVGYGAMRSVGAVVIGLLIGAAAILLTIKLGSSTWGSLIGAAGLALALGFSLRHRGSSWRRGVVVVSGGCFAYVAIATITMAGLDVLLQRGLFGNLLAEAFVRARETVPALWLLVPAVIGELIGGAAAGAIAGALGGAGGWLALALITRAAPTWPTLPIGITCIVLAFAMPFLRPVLMYPFVSALDLVLLRLDERRTDQQRSLLRWHAAFWDEDQRLPLLGLDDYLVLVAERNPEEGRRSLSFIALGPQRWAAQVAQVELDVRILERCQSIEALASVHRQFGPGEFTGRAAVVLRNLIRISRDAAAILEQNHYNQRVSLRALAERTDLLLRELNRTTEPYAVRFARIIISWQETLAQRERVLAEDTTRRQIIESPYVIGLPLNDFQSVFVGRAEVAERIEQLLLQPQRPPLLLYGQRRTGKTSLLHNLGRLLPSTLVPLFIDLQGPASRASNEAGFLYNLANAIAQQARVHRALCIRVVSREELEQDPFTYFEQWLDSLSEQLGDSKALLLLDEFEQLEDALLNGRLERQRILGMLRHIIQHKPQFRVLLAGSHMLDEMKLWASFLINVQVIKLGELSIPDAIQLVEHPVQDFSLRYQPEASMRVIRLTGCHPYLLQLLCDRIVHLKNSQSVDSRYVTRVEDVDAAIDDAVQHGTFFFADIENNQIDEPSRLVLSSLARKGEDAVCCDEEIKVICGTNSSIVLGRLAERDLLESSSSGYRFRSELVRRWFVAQVRSVKGASF